MFFQASYFFVNRRVILALRNSAHTGSPATTSTTNTTTTASSSQRKKKSVRFSGVDTVRYTHSPSEYDRSYQIQQQQQQQHQQRQQKAAAAAAAATNTTTTTMKKSRNTHLRIDTQLALGDKYAGPLFFTQLSTNYGRHCKPHQERNILLASSC